MGCGENAEARNGKSAGKFKKNYKFFKMFQKTKSYESLYNWITLYVLYSNLKSVQVYKYVFCI